MAIYFEHVLELPLAFHTSTHSGRVLKVMLEGSNGMAWLWLGFFREHLAALVALVVLLPLTLFLNWRLGLSARPPRRDLHGPHHDRPAQDRDTAGLRRALSLEPRRARLRCPRQRPGDPVLHPHRGGDARAAGHHPPAPAGAEPGPVLVGARLRRDPRLGDDHRHRDLPRRHLAASQGFATIGEVVTFMAIATMLIGRLEQAVSFVNQLFMQAPKMKEFFEILDTAPAVHDKTGATERRALPGDVAFEDVSFSYDGKRAAVQDVSFAAQPGETSPSSARRGRASRPPSGFCTAPSIRNRASSASTATTSATSPCPRSGATSASSSRSRCCLRARSRENLQVGRPDASDREMIEALERAQALDFIARQSDGLDTVIGERGRSLSGGERQRLSIARALLKNPPILILDEATCALDAATERKLQAALDEVMQRPHHLRHRAPARHDPQRRTHPRLRPRPHRRDRQLRRTRRQGRPLRRTCPRAVHGGRRGAPPRAQDPRRRGGGDVSARPVEFVSAPSS